MLEKIYRNITTDEIVIESDWLEYVCDAIGLKLSSFNEQDDKYVVQQQFKAEFLPDIVEWFFSDNWIYEEHDDEDIPDLERDLELADIIYQDNLEKKWGL